MLNVISVAGRLTNDPVIRSTQNGVSVASFTLACDRDFSNNGERTTDFIDVVAWRNTADFVGKYFGKGRMAIVAGRLQTRNWTDKDGNNRKAVEVIAESVYFGDSKKNEQSESRAATGQTQGDTYNAVLQALDDDLVEAVDLADEELPF